MNTRMNISPAGSRFNASTVREALRLAKEKLGPDAVLLSNRATATGVEIVATAGVHTANGPSDKKDSDIDPIFGNIDSMRGLIDEQLVDLAWNQARKQDPLRGHLLRMLLGAGFSPRLAKELLVQLPTRQSYAAGVDYMKSALACKLPMLASEDALMKEGGVYALMGPTGVGKTTTTAKLAARCVMRFGSGKLALVTTDSYRIGAYEQLRIYGQILGVSVHAVREAADLEMVLGNLGDKHMVLIDTVGMSQRDRAVSDQIAMLCGASRPVKRLLLLNAASHGDTLNEVVQAYSSGQQAGGGKELAGCIFTKVDEATHAGVALDIAVRYQLPVHYVSNGQKVPENLLLAERRALIESVFQSKSRRSLFVASETEREVPMTAPRNETEVAAAEAVNKRLRSQCQQLIKALANNVEEITDTTRALAAGEVGFQESRALWSKLVESQIAASAMTQDLVSRACVNSRTYCRDHVLAITREVDLPASAGASGQALLSTVLLSDRNGLPFAAPGRMLSRAAQTGMAQLGCGPALRMAKPVVHLLGGVPTAALIEEWQAKGLHWAASAAGSLRVLAAESQLPQTLSKLVAGLAFSAPMPLLYLRKRAWSSVAQVSVSLRTEPADPAGAGVAQARTLRCVVRRVMDDESDKQLALHYVLVSSGVDATAQQVVQWADWRVGAEPYFKLLSQGLAQLAENEAVGEDTVLKRMLISGQLASTVFLLQCRQEAWADTARKLLAQLAGKAIRPDRPVPGVLLLEGLGRLFVLLDALATDDSSLLPAAERVMVQV